MKNGKKVLAVLLVSSMVVVPMSIFANSKTAALEIAQNQEEGKGEYRHHTGVIKEVLGSGEEFAILVGNKDNDENQMIYNVFDDVYVGDMNPTRENKRAHLVKGANVTVYYHKNTPVALSYPSQMNPRAIIINNGDKEVQTKLDKFDKDLVSSDGMLKLNMKDAKEYQDKLLLVYYGASTRSIPAQTTPELVVVLEDKNQEVKPEDTKIEKLDGIKYEGKDAKASLYHKGNDVTMISLRDISDIMKYELKWNGKDKPMELAKMPFWTSLQIGKNSYFYNKVAPFELSSAPELKDGKTYVPVDFISEVLQKEVKVVNGVLEVK